MPIPIAPETTILDAALSTIAGSDIETVFELVAGSLKTRHRRHRNTKITETPCISVSLTAEPVDEERQQWVTHSEIAWRAFIDLTVDLDLLPENDDALAPPSDTNDATGWDRLTAMARYAANLLTDTTETAPMRLVVDDIIPGDISPDEDSQPDKGRLVIGVIVLYRTRSDDLMDLLSPGENA